MAPDERERNFDKALGRHLRSVADADRTVPAGFASQLGSCPDTETLAAYHERSLLSEEMNSWKEHIVGCSQCQTILAQLEATDQIALQASAQEEVLAAKEFGQPVITARSLAAPPAAAAPKKSRRVLLLRGPRWQWLAPAGAIAAGLLVWIAFHENQRLPLPTLRGVQVAKQVPAQSTPSTSTATPQTYSSPQITPPKPPSTTDQLPASNSRVATEPVKPSEKLDELARVSPSQHLSDKERALRKDAGNPSAGDSVNAQQQSDRDAKTVSRERQENAEVQVQSQNQTVIVPSQNQYNANAPKVSGPAPMGQSVSEAKKLKAATASPAPPPPPPPQPVGVSGAASSAYNSSAMEVVSALSNPHLISPPGSTLLWRAGRAGVIELSRDNGTSWSRQRSGVLVDLQTGSAPSENVCWIVGRRGTVLRTSDGGAHWKLVSFPLLDDLGGVRAPDALHATIWNLANNKSFETTDGGRTWQPALIP